MRCTNFVFLAEISLISIVVEFMTVIVSSRLTFLVLSQCQLKPQLFQKLPLLSHLFIVWFDLQEIRRVEAPSAPSRRHPSPAPRHDGRMQQRRRRETGCSPRPGSGTQTADSRPIARVRLLSARPLPPSTLRARRRLGADRPSAAQSVRGRRSVRKRGAGQQKRAVRCAGYFGAWLCLVTASQVPEVARAAAATFVGPRRR